MMPWYAWLMLGLVWFAAGFGVGFMVRAPMTPDQRTGYLALAARLEDFANHLRPQAGPLTLDIRAAVTVLRELAGTPSDTGERP